MSSVALTATSVQPCDSLTNTFLWRGGGKIHMSPAIYGLLYACSLIWISYHTCANSALRWLDNGFSVCVLYVCVWHQVCSVHKGQGVVFTYAWGSGFPADHWFDLPCEITTDTDYKSCAGKKKSEKKDPYSENISIHVVRIYLHFYQ